MEGSARLLLTQVPREAGVVGQKGRNQASFVPRATKLPADDDNRKQRWPSGITGLGSFVALSSGTPRDGSPPLSLPGIHMALFVPVCLGFPFMCMASRNGFDARLSGKK